MIRTAVGLGLSAMALGQLNIPQTPINIGYCCFLGQVLTHGLYFVVQRCVRSVAEYRNQNETPNISDRRPTELDIIRDIQISINSRNSSGHGFTEPPYLSNSQDLRSIDLDDKQLIVPPNLSECPVLNSLHLGYNQLAAPPDLSKNPKLKFLYLHGNQLIAPPDLSKNPKLKELHLGYNQLTALPDLSNNPELEALYLDFNQLIAPPDLSKNPKLKELHLGANQLTAPPDLSNNQALESLGLSNNRLTALPDLSNNPELEALYLDFNQLIAPPDLSKNPKLKFLYLQGNQLIAPPDLSNNQALESLGLSNNRLTASPDLSNNQALEFLNLEGNRLTSLHDSILHLPRACTVYAENNRFTAEYAQQIQERIAQIRRENRGLGPDISFGIHDAAAAENGEISLATIAGSWISEMGSEEEKTSETPINTSILEELLKGLDDNQQKLLGHFLAALKYSADYKELTLRSALVVRVYNILELASHQKEFLDNVLNILLDREENPTCGDGIMVQLNDIEVQWHIFRKELNIKDLKELAARIQKHEDLKAHAKKIAREEELGDEAEIILEYQIRLKEALNLPISTENMLYPEMASGITKEMLDKAVQAIDLDQMELLSRSELWRAHLKKDQVQKARFDKVETHFSELIDQLLQNSTMKSQDLVSKADEIRESRERELRKLTCELTDEV